RSAQTEVAPQLTADEYLDRMEEDMNKVVDREIEVLSEAIQEIVKVASVEGKERHHLHTESLHSRLKAESMVRSATNLLHLSHSLKILFLLGDEDSMSKARETKEEAIRNDTTKEQDAVSKALEDLL
ncbi:hypothetical protein BT69DRAFT_1191846, partial [Atractiella rhizophila]